MGVTRQGKALGGRNPAQLKSGRNSKPLQNPDMLPRHRHGSGTSQGFSQGPPFFDLLEQLVTQVVRDVLASQKQESDQRNDTPQLRDVSREEVIRPRDLPLVTGLSRTQCWRLSKDPSSGFPPKIRLSSGAVGFSRQGILEWLKSKEEA